MEFKAHGGGKLPKKSHSLFFHKEKLEIEKKIAWFMSFYKEAHVLSFFFRQKCVLLLGEKEEVLCTFCFYTGLLFFPCATFMLPSSKKLFFDCRAVLELDF